MKFRKQCAATLLALTSLGAFADDRGLYVGAGVTRVEIDDNTLGDDDNSYKAYVGYRLNPYLAVEGAWVDLGSFEGSRGDFDGHSLQAAAHFGVPIGDRLRLFASAGVHAWDAEEDTTGDSSDLDLTYGVGVELDLFRNIGVRLEQEVLKVGDIELDQTSASAYLLF
ncbi:porin family protein [Pseudomonas sp. BN415]|uniref:porin family protein n=1 Tax=Pseudomonas sp. BN415 TaxID=2567889 RepID=UPI002454D75A|nr:porin family protein [Pseudomonas sp. BN415]MDH4580559.1 porin family protein [Pseudomonas sp. BN415]